MTKGEYRVGIDFNPSRDDKVGRIKRAAADLIDLLDELVPPRGVSTNEAALQQGEVQRLKDLAQTYIEDAAMWGVKAVTKPMPQKSGEA